MSRVIKSRPARRDLVELGTYIGQHSEPASRRFLNAAEEAFQRLAAMPGLGSACESDHLALAGLRLWPVRGFPKYLILYRPLEDGIEVLRVFHGARDLESLFDL